MVMCDATRPAPPDANASALPDISVVIANGGSQDDLVATLRSLALQCDVVYETIVVDLAAGAMATSQRAVEESRAICIAFVRAGDILLRGALRAMCDAISGAPQVGMAHALRLPLDAEGRISRDAARSYAKRIRERFPPDRTPLGSLDGRGNSIEALPTFRCEALRGSGGLSGAPFDDALHAATRRIATRWEVRLVSRVLCATPRRDVRHMWRPRLADRAHQLWDEARRVVERIARATRALLLTSPLLRAPGPYTMFSALLQRRPFDGLRLRRRRAPMEGGPRVAYVLWRYPMLSQTFVRREVQALRDFGFPLVVFALEPDDPPAPTDPSSPAGEVTYFGPEDEAEGRASILRCLRRNPWTVVRLWLFLVGHHYRDDKTWWRDRNVLYLAGQLASALGRSGITHVHSPWGDQYALVSFAASRLLGVTFSAQARAYEIHRSVEQVATADRLRFAEFVITNSRYNERHLHELLGATGAPISVIYNGVELQRFHPMLGVERPAGSVRLLAIGRLVEQKGFPYLMRACRLLRDRGLDLSCEIIGGPVEPADTATWLELRMLQTELGLESMVRFSGAKPFSAVLAALARADIFVLPCVRARDGAHDITPNSLIEAMAMGLPVISTASGAIPEIVDHGHDGLLVAPNDESALADALERLVRDACLRRALGTAARRKVEERFDIDRNITRRAALFRSLWTE